tara:strand:+ start:94 stop:423 length:330 start_codon:yes stop_codon:yes gene_type:complete
MTDNQLPSLTEPHFNISSGRGFQMTFKNGYCISVQFGPSSYSERRDAALNAPLEAASNNESWRSETAEVAIFNPDCTFHGDVQGWLAPNEVAELIGTVQMWPRPPSSPI